MSAARDTRLLRGNALATLAFVHLRNDRFHSEPESHVGFPEGFRKFLNALFSVKNNSLFAAKTFRACVFCQKYRIFRNKNLKAKFFSFILCTKHTLSNVLFPFLSLAHVKSSHSPDSPQRLVRLSATHCLLCFGHHVDC
jgi:hypothetical protein